MKLHEVAFSIGEKLDNHSAPRSGPNQQPLASQQRQVYIRTGPSPLPTLDQSCLEATRLAFRHRNKVTFSEVLAVPVVTRNPVRSPANKATEHMEAAGDWPCVQAALDALPEDLRQAVTLREIEGLSYEEIAESMSCPIGTVRSRIFRAREAIAQELKPVLDTAKDKRW